MKWNKLVDEKEIDHRYVWVTNGHTVWITVHGGYLWRCLSKDLLRWAEIEWPEVPVIEDEEEELARLREIEKKYLALVGPR